MALWRSHKGIDAVGREDVRSTSVDAPVVLVEAAGASAWPPLSPLVASLSELAPTDMRIRAVAFFLNVRLEEVTAAFAADAGITRGRLIDILVHVLELCREGNIEVQCG